MFKIRNSCNCDYCRSKQIDDCNNNFDCQLCPPSQPNCLCDPIVPCDKDKSICDVIQSVAQVQTSLAHVINAEGEKIQRAIELACCTKDLLMVNDSVQKTLYNAAKIETALYKKLIALSCFVPKK